MNRWSKRGYSCSREVIRSSKAAEGRRTPRRCRAEACPFQFMGSEQVREEQSSVPWVELVMVPKEEYDSTWGPILKN